MAAETVPALTEAELRRYSRQILLREVGGRGQARLLATRFLVDGDSALTELAVSYLERAGARVESAVLGAPTGFTILAIASPSEAESEAAAERPRLWAVSQGERCAVGVGEATLASEVAGWVGPGLGGGAAFLTAASALSLLALMQALGRLPESTKTQRFRLDASSERFGGWDESL